ncbi:MAG: hypothetical protein JSS82_07065 [Bacteroidetes bacterium]|nr:hypothetical protein [Bacteroidota bacterium]
MKAITFIVECLYWLNIFIVPTCLLTLLGYAGYYYIGEFPGMVCLVAFAITGIISGILWAERVRKTVGCSNYVNRIFSSPDLDNRGKT